MTDTLVAAVHTQLQLLITPDRWSRLEQGYQALQDQLTRLLFESGEFLVQSLEQKHIDPLRKTHYNQAIDLIEKCLLLTLCAQKKYKFLVLLLDVTQNDADVQAQVAYDHLVDQILHVTWFQVQKVILDTQDPSLRCFIPADLLELINGYRQTFTNSDVVGK